MFSLLPLATLVLSGLSAVAAAPIPAKAPPKTAPKFPKFPHGKPPHGFLDCTPPADFAMNLPAGQTNISVPAGQVPKRIALGRGTQNYTCTNGAWASAGAVATLVDVSCLAGKIPSDQFFGLPSVALSMPNPPDFSASNSNPLIQQIVSNGPAIGHHYFVSGVPGQTAAVPKFDFTTTDPADQSLYVTLTKAGALDDPVNKASNVQWLQLSSIAGQGSLASTVFRIDTAGGPASGTCTTNGDSQLVDYASLYAFYG